MSPVYALDFEFSYVAYLTGHTALLLFIMLPPTEHESSSQVLSPHNYLSDTIIDLQPIICLSAIFENVFDTAYYLLL